MKNQRKWENPELSPEAAKLFIDGCKEHGIDVAECCLPHGSYLVNLAHPDAVRKKQAYDSFLNDLARCNTLGIKLYNFHLLFFIAQRRMLGTDSWINRHVCYIPCCNSVEYASIQAFCILIRFDESCLLALKVRHLDLWPMT